MSDRELFEREFNVRLRAYAAAAREQHDWDAIAPVGMTTRQMKKEEKLHSATEEAYASLWEFVCAAAEGERAMP